MKLAHLLTLSSLALIQSTQAVTVVLDYTYDTNNFFGNAQAKASLEAAVAQYTSVIDQSFSAITPGGSNTWDAVFLDPSTGQERRVTDLVIPADTIVIYVGARDLNPVGSGTPGNPLARNLGRAGRGGFSASGTLEFNEAVLRGDSADKYALWGGVATFDINADWQLDHTSSAIGSEQSDFYTVAVHELGHLFGIAADNDAWNDHWTQGSTVGDPGQFTGVNALAAYNSDNGLTASFVPTVLASVEDPTNRHFLEGLESYLPGTTTLQEASLDPTILNGTRKHLTNVDIAALYDIGWRVPEPSTSIMLALSATTLILRRRRYGF
ncbi:PEP-CTERM sorting domain-containing protein [Sulfuriroseicoccus oceanibius]|uniref:PEP-CTERM sorting domain-containing protein n=1 Tax=Sulfuriroseicoccus oceanibius TaxID=2707525 RepID=A0A6B3L375_9BACT|nr:PEP-CTERM sorting domain-containing protein [Sulfuriroseicoccus oceanibius]QQL45256.1 PEP-CTERM sorting domain-containing protein [Sulfuriroseicoccus oceanibius]